MVEQINSAIYVKNYHSLEPEDMVAPWLSYRHTANTLKTAIKFKLSRLTAQERISLFDGRKRGQVKLTFGILIMENDEYP